ncbi:MAG: hypothetical protein WC397_04185 [Candidatus Paceibacterota bacterium]|jgi:hypothetical protein
MKISSKKIIISTSLLAVLSAGLLITGVSLAAAKRDVAGWAWSDTIGSISFSSTNCDANEDGLIDVAACGNVGNSITPYKVTVDDSSGALAGYAWSDTIGVISFNGAETGTPPDSYNCGTGCVAKVDATNKVIGWARALSACKDNYWNGSACTNSGAGDRAGGWDGWIKMSSTSYSVTLGPAVGGIREFLGFAWGGATSGASVINSISFNSKNCDTDSDGFSNGGTNCPTSGTAMSSYRVIDTGTANNPPVASFSCDPSMCNLVDSNPCKCYNDNQSLLVLRNSSTDPQGDSDITKSEWTIGGVAYSACNATMKGDCPLPKLLAPGTYSVGLTVTDAGSKTSSTSNNVTFIQGPAAGFSCSLDGTNWYDCEDVANIKPDQGAAVYLKDDLSAPYEHSVASQGASITGRTWSYNGVTTGISGQGTSDATTTLSVLPAVVQLQITDNNGRTAVQSHNIAVIPLPKWKELPPFQAQ